MLKWFEDVCVFRSQCKFDDAMLESELDIAIRSANNFDYWSKIPRMSTPHGQNLGCPDTMDSGHQWISAFDLGIIGANPLVSTHYP